MTRQRVSTGIDGLDRVLQGGLLAERSYMLRGPPGAGKTIVCFHFLAAGVAAGETTLFVNLEEDLTGLRADAESLGFPADDVAYMDGSPSAEVFTEDESYDVFTAADVENDALTDRIVDRVRAVEPDRVVVDPLTQLRYLASSEYQFRKQIVGLMRFLTNEGATVLFTTQETGSTPTEELEFISDGAIQLERTEAGPRVDVPKLRGSGVQAGDHAYRVTDTGVVVYPELDTTAVEDTDDFGETISSGVSGVDELLHGGIERGTVTIVSGPTGVGKTTLGTQFAKEAAGRGERSVVYLFEESERTYLQRSRAVDIPVEEMRERGTLGVEEIEALDLSAQEFAQQVRSEVERNDTSIVMIDGIAGYRLIASGERDLVTRRLHALSRYLKNAGVTTIIIEETSNVTGDFKATDQNITYLADGIVFLRHLEVSGELQKVIGVLKKRTGDFERRLRQFQITESGLDVGEPLTSMRGILTGTPEKVGDPGDATE